MNFYYSINVLVVFIVDGGRFEWHCNGRCETRRSSETSSRTSLLFVIERWNIIINSVKSNEKALAARRDADASAAAQKVAEAGLQ